MEQKKCLRLIYKIHSKQLKQSKWNLNLPLDTALNDYPETVVSISNNQMLRFIDELNGVGDIDSEIKSLQRKIKVEKKKPRSKETKSNIRSFYKELYTKQFLSDYVCVIMDSNKDYDRANSGFTINGIRFRRFLGTNGGIKNSTIVYVNENLYDELKRRLDNGRKMDKPLVPAKLEAYQALVCSGSTPIPKPNGIIVVKDCITHFKEDVILITDEDEGEPRLTYQEDYEIEHNDSDGFGLMLPQYSTRVNQFLTGRSTPLSGMNTRYAWTKGMVYTFDFIEFAEKVAGTYEIEDVWGDKRDVRNAEVILTESMLKLWNCYDSWEDYYENCEKNHYQFSTPKITPEELENSRDMNYQFLQSYNFTDGDIQDLCQPTINEIDGVVGMDYRKTLAYLMGVGVNKKNVWSDRENFIKALTIEPSLINDTFIRKKIYSMIKKRMDCAKKGSIKVDANYAMISGDPYALAQNMFGLSVTGLLKKWEVYHKYWIDKGAEEIVCFRAPMTCHNNIRKMRLNKGEQAQYWYRYIKTALIYNAWDSACEAMNGADKDGDTNMCTDNPILLERTQNSPTIICMQRSAKKIVPTEEDIVAANKLAFNDDIGVITNYVTSMFDAQAKFDKDTLEYKELEYRIMCGQHFQQTAIDRCKGIVAKSMPKYWYSLRDIKKAEGINKELNEKIVAAYKPYFMIYVYPHLKQTYGQYEKNSNKKAIRTFRKYKIGSVDDLEKYEPKTQEMVDFLYYYELKKKVGDNSCVVNRICDVFEAKYPNYSAIKNIGESFDYTILKCGVEYMKKDYDELFKLLQEYRHEYDSYREQARYRKNEDDNNVYSQEDFINRFKMRSLSICSNEQELCDIVLDLCYKTDGLKQFAWDIAGDTIIENLLKRNNYTITYPECTGNEFEFGGNMFTMQTIKLEGDEV